MRKIKLALVFIIGFILISCETKFDLKTDKHLTQVFTDSELQEIQKMINYVDNRVVKLTNNKDIDEAYHQLLSKIDVTMQDSSKFLVPFEEEQKYEFLQSLDTTVFNEFWTIGHVRKGVYADSVYENLDNYKTLDISGSGRYADYLERVGEDDACYKSVKESLENAGGLTPAIVASFLNMHNELDFTIPKNRLWATVFILRIEESHDKKMEQNLNQKK